MSMAVGHFAVGAMATALLLTFVAPRFLQSPTVLVAGGVWAMVPDVHHVLPVGSELVRSFHMTAWSNVFWAHLYFDGIDSGDSRPLAAGLVIGLLIVLASCELFSRARLSSTVIDPVESPHE